MTEKYKRHFPESVGEFILLLPKLIHHPFKTISPVKAPRKGQWGRWSGKKWSEIRTATFFRSHCGNFNPVAKCETPKEKKEKGRKKAWRNSFGPMILRTMSNTAAFIPKVFREGALGFCFSKGR